MLSKYIPKRFAQAMIKHVVAVSLFFPYIYSHRDNCYYQDFILANFFAVLSIIFIFTSWKLDLRKNGILLAGMGILLIAYNVCFTYMNHHYHHWYGEQINTTIIFLFFMVLLMVKDVHAFVDNNMIRSIIHMMVISNVLAIGYRLITDENRILIMNNYVRLDKYVEIMEEHFSWLYIYKSNYSFILVVCVAFCVINKKIFSNTITYIMSLGVLLVSIYLSTTYTAIVAVILIFIGQFLDYLWNAKWWEKTIGAFILGLPFIFVCIKFIDIIINNRELLTLNGRIRIWKGSWETITYNANGMIDFTMGVDKFPFLIHSDGWSLETYNCHNVFMNQMFRFSILVGGIYALLIIIILLIALNRKTSFTTLFVLPALILPPSMDYCLTNIELIFFISIMYVMYFRQDNCIAFTKNHN